MKEPLRAFPKFVAGILLGLLIAILTKVEVFLLVILAVLLSLAWSFWIGVAIAFGLYTIFYMLSQYVGMYSQQQAAYLNMYAQDINARQANPPVRTPNE